MTRIGDHCHLIGKYRGQCKILTYTEPVDPIDNIIKGMDGRIVIDVRDKLKRGKEYLLEFFDDGRPPKPVLLRTEVVHPLKSMKSGETIGPDEILIEHVKLFDDDVIDILLELFNIIHEKGAIPTHWLLSTFELIPKKQNSR